MRTTLIAARLCTVSVTLPSARAQSEDVSRQQFLEDKTKAETGDAVAQRNLGHRYYRGDGVPRDDAEAVKWFKYYE
jgi:TPR repeat protein